MEALLTGTLPLCTELPRPAVHAPAPVPVVDSSIALLPDAQLLGGTAAVPASPRAHSMDVQLPAPDVGEVDQTVRHPQHGSLADLKCTIAIGLESPSPSQMWRTQEQTRAGACG